MRNIIAEKWRAYAGPQDERITAERNRQYTRLSKILLVVALAVVYYGQALRNAAERAGALDGASAYLDALQPETLLSLGVLVGCAVTLAPLSRQGIVTDDRFAETPTFPRGYFALCSLIGAVSIFVGIVAVNVLAQAQFGQIFWAGDLAFGAIVAGTVFVCCYIAFYIYYREAKRNRDRIEAELGD